MHTMQPYGTVLSTGLSHIYYDNLGFTFSGISTCYNRFGAELHGQYYQPVGQGYTS